MKLQILKFELYKCPHVTCGSLKQTWLMAKFSARIPAFHATTIYESNSTRKPKRSSSKESAAAVLDFYFDICLFLSS